MRLRGGSGEPDGNSPGGEKVATGADNFQLFCFIGPIMAGAASPRKTAKNSGKLRPIFFFPLSPVRDAVMVRTCSAMVL
jgi:hypothetical protein